MVNDLAQYTPILQRGVDIFESIMQLYTENLQDGPYFTNALKDARGYRNTLLERIKNPAYLKNTFEGNFFLSLTHFLDNHWGDYLPDSPKPDTAKHSRMEGLRTELEKVKNDIISVHNSLAK